MSDTIKKRFPADTSLKYTTFLNDKKVNAELYALLQTYSIPDNEERTIIQKKDLPTQVELCAMLGIKSPKTYRAHLDYLIKNNFVIDDKKDYILPRAEDIYFLISLDTIKFLNDTTKENVVKIYIYLGQRYKYKNNYEFTIEEIATHIGIKLGNNARNYEMINNALICLQNHGLIDYVEKKNARGHVVKKLKSFSLTHKGSSSKNLS